VPRNDAGFHAIEGEAIDVKHQEEQELKDRLSLIESMIAEGRRTTESWGWTFVLWGVAYYIAIAWSTWGHSYDCLAGDHDRRLAILTDIRLAKARASARRQPLGRAMMAIWAGMGISIFLLMMSLSISGRLELHVAVAIVGAMLGARTRSMMPR
jgi:hypothetical protein